jgi:hypothetical protein
MVVEVRPPHAQLSDEELLGFGESDTAVQGSARQSEKVKRTSGIVGAGESEKEIGVQPPPPMPSRAEMGLSEPAPPPEGSGSRRNFMIMALGAVLAIGGIAAGGVAWWANPAQAVEARPQDDAETETAVAEPENTAAAEPVVEKDTTGTANTEDAAEAVGETPPQQEPVAPAVTPTRPAKLTVVVFPWGDVWINGKPRGAAPLKNESLKPGRYKVSVGRGSPTQTQTVRLRSGDRKKLQFDLTKP